MVTTIDRRSVMRGATALGAIALLPSAALATPETMAAAMASALNGVKPQAGRIKLEISPLAESGNSVPLTITVDSPMTAADHVKAIYLFAPENPLPDVVRFYIGPRAGRAQIKTAIRLATSQAVYGFAIMSDGSAWSTSADVIVTLSACIDAG